ncbi:hypothetical protein AAFN88_16960 [Pelagibius sp. CAU 1746]|uniref:hypothetical protein n=1 Tax=Pelagibius sp. CAU 1746 TaxID=3140370 RepID=UPI00325BEB51
MTPSELSALFGLGPSGSSGLSRDRFLKVDDLLSRGGDDLGLDVDPSGRLVLVEGRDFD